MDPLGSLAILNSSDSGDLSSNALLKIPPGSTTVYCPVNINNRHWILLILRRLTSKIEVYDPQGNEHPDVIRKYKIFLGPAWQPGRYHTLSWCGSSGSPVSRTVSTVVYLSACTPATS